MEYIVWIGFLYLLFGSVFLVRKETYDGIMRKIKKDPDYLYSLGIFALVLGTYMLATSGIFHPPVSIPGVVISTIILVKSTYLLLFPSHIEKTVSRITKHYSHSVIGAFLVFLSAFCFFLATIVG